MLVVASRGYSLVSLKRMYPYESFLFLFKIVPKGIVMGMFV
jgi:hypothetical protein